MTNESEQTDATIRRQRWDTLLTTVSRGTRKLAQQVMQRHAGAATGRSCTARLARRGWVLSYEQGAVGVFIGVYGGRRFSVSARSAAATVENSNNAEFTRISRL